MASKVREGAILKVADDEGNNFFRDGERVSYEVRLDWKYNDASATFKTREQAAKFMGEAKAWHRGSIFLVMVHEYLLEEHGVKLIGKQ